jgi:hypothetical protein
LAYLSKGRNKTNKITEINIMSEFLINPLAIGGIVAIIAVVGYLVYAYMSKSWPF